MTDGDSSAYIALARANLDIVDEMMFCATMQLRIPLRVLKMHCARHQLANGDPPIFAMHEGIWVGMLRGQKSLFGEMASDIGPIPTDGGNYLAFLKAVRGIVEDHESTTARMDRLQQELGKQEWQEFVTRHGGSDCVCNRFFPCFLDTIPRLRADAAETLREMSLTTPARLAAASDGDLCAVRGVGAVALRSIRQACEDAADKHSEWVDMVQR